MRVKDARQTFLGYWVRLLLEGQPFEVWEGAQLRDFTYVDDVVDALLRAAVTPAADGAVLNLGGDRVVSLQELAERLVAIHGRGEYRLCSFPPERKRIDIGDYYASYGRAERVLGWRPAVALEEGLGRTLAFYREHLKEYV